MAIKPDLPAEGSYRFDDLNRYITPQLKSSSIMDVLASKFHRIMHVFAQLLRGDFHIQRNYFTNRKIEIIASTMLKNLEERQTHPERLVETKAAKEEDPAIARGEIEAILTRVRLAEDHMYIEKVKTPTDIETKMRAVIAMHKKIKAMQQALNLAPSKNLSEIEGLHNIETLLNNAYNAGWEQLRLSSSAPEQVDKDHAWFTDAEPVLREAIDQLKSHTSNQPLTKALDDLLEDVAELFQNEPVSILTPSSAQQAADLATYKEISASLDAMTHLLLKNAELLSEGDRTRISARIGELAQAAAKIKKSLPAEFSAITKRIQAINEHLQALSKPYISAKTLAVLELALAYRRAGAENQPFLSNTLGKYLGSYSPENRQLSDIMARAKKYQQQDYQDVALATLQTDAKNALKLIWKALQTEHLDDKSLIPLRRQILELNRLMHLPPLVPFPPSSPAEPMAPSSQAEES